MNSVKQEVRLFENGGTGAGKLLVKSDEPADKVSIADAMQLLNMGLRFAVNYELLVQCATDETRGTLERIGAKEFLEKILSLSNNDERRMRFQGFNFSFANGAKATPPTTPSKRQERSSQKAAEV